MTAALVPSILGVMLLAIAGLTVAMTAAAWAILLWRRLAAELAAAEGDWQARHDSLAEALRQAMTEAARSRQRAEELEAAAAASCRAAERSQDFAERCMRACEDSATAAGRSAGAAAATGAEASRAAEASAASARGAEQASQSALRAAAAAEGLVRIGQQGAQGVAASARAAEEAASAAAASAKASAETAQSNWALAELGKRAWVHATEFRAALKTQGTENSTLEMRIANLGNTPARQLKVSTSFQLEDAIPDELPLKPRANNIVLGPGVSFSISHFLRVSPADLAAITTGRRVLLACGQADYVDVLGIARQTRWCAVYNYNGNSFTPAARHNLTA